MRSRFRAGLVLIIAAGVALAAAPAYAEPTPVQPASTSQCTSGEFCLWSSSSYAGAFASVRSSALTSTGFAAAKSLWNRSGYAAIAYSGSLGTGSSKCYPPGTQISSTTVGAASIKLTTSVLC